MRYLKLIACLFALLSGVSFAQEKYVPDYFPAPLGAEWHYKLTSTAGMNMEIKTVIAERQQHVQRRFRVF